MIPTDLIFTTSLVRPFSECMEVREIAASTVLSNAEIALAYGIDESQVRYYLHANPVLVNLFWEEIRHGIHVGIVHVSTLKGEETLGRFKTWGGFWQAAAENGWIFDEKYRRLNGPNLPNLTGK